MREMQENGIVVKVTAAILVWTMLILLCPYRDGLAVAKSSEPSKTVAAPATNGPSPTKMNTSGKKKMSIGKGSDITLLPDLVVERIWLDDDCFLNFRIKNRGKGHIPDNQFLNGNVQVIHGKVA